MTFSLDANNIGYQRLISFDGLNNDEGLYAYDNYIYFYDNGPDDDTFTFLAGELINLRVSRDGATDIFPAYLNDTFLWDFVDSSDYAVITEPSQLLTFFEDDGSEDPTGFVDSIKIYDDPVGANNNVPEPEVALLLASGLLGLFGARKKLK